MSRRTDDVHCQCVRIDVGVVGENAGRRNGQQRVFRDGVGTIAVRHGIVVYGQDVEGDGGHPGVRRSIAHLIGERVGPEKVVVRIVG